MIEVAVGLLEGEFFSFFGDRGTQLAVITDSNVLSLYGKSFCDRLKSEGYRAELFTFPAGEENKTSATVNSLQECILQWGVDRDLTIVALGGGVATDIAGYIAATLLRGVELILVPTTLLAMVDASIGGKNGVNTRCGKNLIGTFYQPKQVLIDPLFLKTLTEPLFLEGVAEMIKHGAVVDRAYFTFLVERREEIVALEMKVLERAILRSVEIKRGVVSEDEREKRGKRRILNFGHTIGHAIELVTRYEVSHGYAVSIGMVLEAEISCRMNVLCSSSKDQLIDLLNHYHLPTSLPEKISAAELALAMKYDKKSQNQKARSVVLQGIGVCHPFGGEYCTEIEEEMLNAVCVDQALR